MKFVSRSFKLKAVSHKSQRKNRKGTNELIMQNRKKLVTKNSHDLQRNEIK